MIDFLTIKQLELLPTHRLLAYRKKYLLRVCPPEDYIWDCDCDRCTSEKAYYKKRTDLLKATKVILDTRGHVNKQREKNNCKKCGKRKSDHSAKTLNCPDTSETFVPQHHKK
jgi:hypothetical protein